MNQTPENRPTLSSALFQNWPSLAGLVIASGSVFAFLLLFVLDIFGSQKNPYVGILAYLIAPGFLFLGLGLIALGYVLQRRMLRKSGGAGAHPMLLVDLSAPRNRRHLVVLVFVSVGFLLLTAIGSYQTYHFTESVNFCGQTCHEVMKPEFTTYLHSPHARVACTECHIGPGAKWFVKAKISGTYQVYSVLFDKYHRPIETPVKNLRPAQDTCERCHWPQKFVGNLDRTYTHFLTDETNTPYSVRMSLRVGGADPRKGPVAGIHWHVSEANRVEYIATDEKRQVIPWVRLTGPDGKVTEFRAKDFKDDPAKHVIRTMDCMDCHNRPSHVFKSPNELVDLSLRLGMLDPSIPFIKKEAVAVLAKAYANGAEAMQKIEESLKAKYAQHPKLGETVQEVRRIYQENFFPEMKSSWRAYPNNVGHKDWPGCFRCHDDQHKSADDKHVIRGKNCEVCHVLLAEGKGADLDRLEPKGLTFKHPEEGWEGMKCNDCHTGANE